MRKHSISHSHNNAAESLLRILLHRMRKMFRVDDDFGSDGYPSGGTIKIYGSTTVEQI